MSPNESSSLLPDSASVHSAASSSAFSLGSFRQRMSNAISARLSPSALPTTAPLSRSTTGEDATVIGADSAAVSVNEKYTGLEDAPVPVSTTLLGAPRNSEYGAIETDGAAPTGDGAPKYTRDYVLYQAKNLAFYYVPLLTWMPHYKLSALPGDLIAGLSVASFNLPLSISYALNLCHVPAKYGLIGFAFPQLVYSVLGSVPIMVTGPEPAISFIVGETISPFIYGPDRDPMDAIIYVALISFIGAISLILASFLRLGFLDSILSKSFLRGFISAAGCIIFVDQLIIGLGLSALGRMENVGQLTAVGKLGFIFRNLGNTHFLTAMVFFPSLIFMVFFKYFKQMHVHQMRWLAYVPDILLVVICSTAISFALKWDNQGLEVLGAVDVGSIELRSPLTASTFDKFKEILSGGILVTVLGFYQSAIVAKSFADSDYETNVSGNREMFALGVSNLVGTFMFSLPVYGGYGRSKANKLCGATSQVSSMVFGVVSIIVLFFLMPLLYYLPNAILGSVLSIVCLAMVEETPAALAFYYKIKAFKDIGMIVLILIIGAVVSLKMGILIGIVINIFQVLRHATRQRIQILGRVPGTNEITSIDNPVLQEKTDKDVDLESNFSVEQIDHCLVVKIAEPMTFSNCGELKTRLKRLEKYGTLNVHPSQPRTRESDKNGSIIMDLEGMTDCDTSAIQALLEIVRDYKTKGQLIYFSRLTAKRHVRDLFYRSGMVKLVTYEDGVPAFYSSISEAMAALDRRNYDQDSATDFESMGALSKETSYQV
ncbi:sulfate transporter family-domain-containing protein [Dipodascopsis tothii]|uniref:sulfate transporter family-domain-containing protein n=1 Tax=Dipodascopsis tothii TaxID=44089 RepID=UPI0034CF65E3